MQPATALPLIEMVSHRSETRTKEIGINTGFGGISGCSQEAKRQSISR